ncbi:hypothetical protein VP1G_08719 [Cytospora mali]|uniref:Xylanolytic transcriptional activator regulatory domain-containing protein n=1 Tax=Cytospora mali TaxID=578113 RepID=A0A194VC52_CYTMA|nr:hypothetical protein VP1G_08719 [Valsa mali var. pyri (nom. inval.)]
MTVKLDDFDPGQKRQYVLVGVTIGLVLATVSTVLRTWAKLMSTKRLRSEDYFMFAALFLCLTTGLGQHEDTLTKLQMRHFLISLWVIQRLQPPSLFCVKTSIIIFYIRVFPTRAIRIAGWSIWIYTFLWLVGIWFATLFECHPISYFWDKSIKNGHCLANPLITIGLTSGVLSCVGDIVIFTMPIPVVLGLNMNRRKKAALAAIFAVGLFVITTSFVRWVALLTTKSDITSNQVEAGVWTYLEISIGITCGNLPLLLPLVRSWFSTGDTSRGYRGGASDNLPSGGYVHHAATQRSSARKPSPYGGFLTLDDSPSGSQVELRNRNNREKNLGLSVSGDSVGGSSNGLGPEVIEEDITLAEQGRPDGGIVVQTSVDVRLFGLQEAQDTTCLYEDEPPQPRQQTYHVEPVPHTSQTSPVSVDGTIPNDTNSTTPSYPRSSVVAVSTPSTVESQAAGSSSKPVEAMKSRIRRLEEQLYKASSSSTHISSETPSTDIETTATKMSEAFHVHRGNNRLSGQAALISRSISHKTRLFGQSHWVNSILPLIRDLVELLDSHFRNENSEALSTMHKCKLLARAIKSQRTPCWPCPLTPDLPTKELADGLVEHYLQTIETVYRIVHVPTFKEQYKAMWDLPEAKRDRPFLVQLKLILALGAVTYDEDFSLRSQAIRWIYEAQTFLSEPIFKSRLKIQILQAQILLLLAKELVDISGDSVWIAAGSLVRTAFTMGLHRDPSHLPKMEPLAVEMRRRLWNTILELSLQASMTKGCPPLISICDFDTQSPLNLEDDEITPDSADVGSERPISDYTRVSIPNALRLTLPARLKVAKFLNDLESDSGTYEAALKLDAEVRSAFKELRQRLRTCLPDGNSPSGLPRPTFAIQAVDFIMHRYLSSLHMSFFGVSLQEPAYAFSRKVVVDTCLNIWCAAWPSSSIHSASHSAVVDEDDLFSRIIRNGSGFFRTVAAQSAFIVPAELGAQLREDQGMGPTPLRRDLVDVMEEAKTWCLRCIRAGETSAKGYILASLIAAQVEGLKRGLDRDQFGRFLVETVEQAGKTCLPILEDMEKRARSEDMREDVNGMGTDEGGGSYDFLPGLTSDWDFTMPDSIFTDNDGTMDWSLGGGTMQGLSFW